MSSPSRNSERPVEDEDILADNEVMFEEEEGEDLFGENMAADYAERPELDQYDPDMLDQTEHEVMTVEQRMAAEQAMQRRDRAGRRRQRSDPGTPGFPSSSPGGGLSDAEGASSGPEGSTPGSGRKARSKRRRMRGEHTSEFGDADGLEDDDEAMPESFYDLTHEKLDETLSKNQGIEKRLETKIKRCFKQFILKFRVEA